MTLFCFQSESVSEELKSVRLYTVFETLGYVWPNLISYSHPNGGEELKKLTTLQGTTLVHFVCRNVCVLTVLGEDMELEMALLL